MKVLKKDIYIALVSIILFILINIVGGSANDSFGYSSGFHQVKDSILLIFAFGVFYVISTLFNFNLRKSLRLPLIRSLFWLLIAMPLFVGSNGVASADFIDAIIPKFCFLVTTICLLLAEATWLTDIKFGMWGVMILGVSVYQFIVLEIST